jgi:hypothetical protein
MAVEVKLFVTLSRGSIVACDTMSCTGNWGKVSGLLGACRVLASVLFTDSLLCKFMCLLRLLIISCPQVLPARVVVVCRPH